MQTAECSEFVSFFVDDVEFVTIFSDNDATYLSSA